ncbi:hypothetical protein H1R20_g3782, partial [Candolleomyces eurysporus]
MATSLTASGDQNLLLLAAVPVLTAALWYSLRKSKFDVDSIRGPPSDSWWYGNVYHLLGAPLGELEREWQSQYGDIVRLQGSFANPVLLVMDPKAIQYIFQNSVDNFHLDRERNFFSEVLLGNALPVIDGEKHKRQRKILLPGFSAAEVKSHLGIFTIDAAKLVEKWKKSIDSTSQPSAVINTTSDMTKATLDAIGIVAFDYSFNALDDSNNELTQAYQDILFTLFGKPRPQDELALGILRFIPENLVRRLLASGPIPKLRRAQAATKLADGLIARSLRDKQIQASVEHDKSKKDILSLISRAYTSDNEKMRLSDSEMVSTMKTMILAGNDTTSTSLTWALYELAKAPALQAELRREIHEMNTWEPTFKELESMTLLNAIIMETLRMQPSLGTVYRQLACDEVIPLSTPIKTSDGRSLHELPVPKNTKFLVSIESYNRHPDIWGADAGEFNPKRWLDANGKLGMNGYSDIVLEIQAFLFQIIGHLEFAPSAGSEKIVRMGGAILTPIVPDEFSKGAQMPLTMKYAKFE